MLTSNLYTSFSLLSEGSSVGTGVSVGAGVSAGSGVAVGTGASVGSAVSAGVPVAWAVGSLDTTVFWLQTPCVTPLVLLVIYVIPVMLLLSL